MSALGDCSLLTASTFISINEVTTVAGAFALAPFMTGIQSVGTTPTNITGLAHAFASANKLVNFTTGYAPGPALPSDAIAPVQEINTLADVLATCVNSRGLAGDDSSCDNLFAATNPIVGPSPTNTLQAILNIAHSPTQSVPSIFALSSPTDPFNPQLSKYPNDWTISISYRAAGTLSVPKSTTVDRNGNIWIANSPNNSVTVLAQSGSPVSA